MAQMEWRRLFNKQTLVILMMGFASGLPIALTWGTLQAWMKTENVDLSTIGLFAFVTLPYSFKFLWSPFMDRYGFGKFGHRRGWMLTTQIFLIASILALSFTRPQESLLMVAIFALLVAFFSASQDIAIDAWRREALTDEELGWGSSVHVSSYLFAFRMISGAAALILSDQMPWSQVYQLMAVLMLLGVVATFLCTEPNTQIAHPKSLREAVIAPFKDYFSRPGAWMILIFILLYKLGDNLALQMTTPFFMDIGFTKTEIGAITKVVGWVSLTVGGLLGGALILRWGIFKSLFIFGIFQLLAVLSFVGLALIGKNSMGLTGVIAFENFAVGMGTSAFVAFMASLTNKSFTATQYALLTSLMGVPRSLAAAPTGFLAERMGWPGFFLFCTLMAIPGLLLLGPLRKKIENVS